jgi:hypothetical protein
MSFEPASPINIVVCDQCHGAGCDACDHLGVYALKDDLPVGFKLPGFIDLKARRYLKSIFLIKRAVLVGVTLFILIFIYALSR